jgi:hypothetical protein
MKRFAAAVALLLGGCATAPSTRPVVAPAPSFDAPALVAAVRAAGTAGATEVDVQPLQDALVVDLRDQARRDEQAGRLSDAASALDRALAERPQDPTLLQERAEVALLQLDVEAAAGFARRAHAAGPTVGPLCRRSLEMLLRIEGLHVAAGGDGAGARATALAAQRDACTLKPPPRY